MKAVLAMPDLFVPLAFTPEQSGRNNSFQLIVLTETDTKPAFEALPALSSPPAPPCGQPVVALQRNGDAVSGIRIQCPCGQVIDLECKY